MNTTTNPLLEHIELDTWKQEYAKMLDSDPRLSGKLIDKPSIDLPLVLTARQNQHQTKPLFNFTQALKEVGLL